MRLQKVLQKSGVSSRRTAAEYIKSGRVCVDGEVIYEPSYQVAVESQEITVDGAKIELQKRVLYALHKPAGVICSMRRQGESECISNYLSKIKQRVVPIGRLDKDVTGLLLLTNDGDFAYHMQHPRFGVERKYWAVSRVQTQNVSKALQRLIEGIELDDGPANVLSIEQIPASKIVQNQFLGIPENCCLLELVVAEGRHHFVKRILAAVNLPVVKLCRVGFGAYQLQDLASGCLRVENFEKMDTYFSSAVDKE